MKNMKTKMLALMLVVIMALTGCATEEESVKINADGSGISYTNVTIDEEACIDAMLKLYKSMGLSDEEISAVEPMLKSELAKNFKEMGAKEATINGKKCYQIEQTQSIKKGNLTKDVIGEEEGYITTDTFYMKANIGKMLEETMNETGDTGMSTADMTATMKAAGIDLDSAIKITVTVEFPKAVVSTANGTVDVSNKNKVIFNLKATDNKTLFATTNAKVTLASARAKYKADNTIKKPAIKKLKANKVSKKAKKATVFLKIGKVSGAKKYQVQYSTKASFKGAKTKTIKKTTYKLTKLKKGTKYYVRVRAVKTNMAGTTVTSKWTKKSVKTKK